MQHWARLANHLEVLGNRVESSVIHHQGEGRSSRPSLPLLTDAHELEVLDQSNIHAAHGVGNRVQKPPLPAQLVLTQQIDLV